MKTAIAMNKALYTCDELQAALNSTENILLVGVLSPDDFAAGHIPSSQHITPDELMLNEKPAPGLLPATAQLQASFERIGLNKDQTVIAYDNAGGSLAGRFIWTLALFDFHNTAMLNGGLKAWQSQGLSLSQITTPVNKSHLNLSLNTAFLASKEEVLASLNKPDTQIWDARSEEEYRGEKILAERGGHIPGAISYDWVNLHDANTAIKDLNEISQSLQEKGFDAEKTIITHCQTHRRSGLTWFVAYKLLGFKDIKAYAGSWSEWGNNPALPIE